MRWLEYGMSGNEDPFYEPPVDDPSHTGQGLVWALIIGFVLVLAVGFAYAGLRFEALGSDNRPIVLRLFITPCSNKMVLLHLRTRIVDSSYIAKFKSAVLTWRGKDWASCWIEVGGLIYSIDEEGAPLEPIPFGFFRNDSI